MRRDDLVFPVSGDWQGAVPDRRRRLTPVMASRSQPVRLKRVHEEVLPADGLRILVDRLWPRGITRAGAAVDLWLKDAAPSTGLRQWYGHDPQRWKTFGQKYRTELLRRPEVLDLINDLRRRAPITLVFGAANMAQNHAIVLRAVLEEHVRGRRSANKAEKNDESQ